MKKSMKSTAAMLLAAILTLSLGVWAQAEGLTGAAALYESASSAVVGVYAMGETWSRESGASIAERDYGTGLYVDERGYVLTCWHLIQSADFVEIETASGERVRVSEILSDNTVDIAVLKLEAPLEGVQPLSLGGEARVGQRVYAIANAFDAFGVYPAQMTAGVVSGVKGDTERAANFSRTLDLIRADAAIGYGGCGGALLDESGALIGLATRLVDSEGAESESAFTSAIPAATLQKVMGDLIEYGAVKRPRMGVMVVDNDGPEDAIKNYPPCGSLVSEVEAGGPADKAGLLKYDVITAIDGVRTRGFAEMSRELEKHQAGDTITVTVYRCADPE
ncbi:MAG: S1C family serine protease, partial [Clostridiales bacterium]|nr:S1C family serine protease [Clostridiales bacterium]